MELGTPAENLDFTIDFGVMLGGHTRITGDPSMRRGFRYVTAAPISMLMHMHSNCSTSEFARIFQEAVGERRDQLDGARFFNLRIQRLPDLPVSLEVIDCFDCGLTELPEHFPLGLKSLTIRRSPGLTSVAGTVFHEGLEEIVISGCSISELPGLPGSLIVLNVSCNKFRHLPALPSGLRTLEASCNMIREIPGPLENLESLVLVGNPLVECPRVRGSLRRYSASMIVLGYWNIAGFSADVCPSACQMSLDSEWDAHLGRTVNKPIKAVFRLLKSLTRTLRIPSELVKILFRDFLDPADSWKFITALTDH